MATRRRTRTPQGYRDGGAVPLDDIVAAPSGAPAMPGPAPAEPIAENGDAVLQALRSTERAEELHREAATKAPHEAAVDSMAGLSEAKRAFLKANPILVTRPDVAKIASEHYHAGLASGIRDDSPELERFILEKTADELAKRRKLAEGSARWRADDEASRQAAAALEREAEELHREAGADDAPAEEEPRVAPRAPVPQPRRGIPISAPVSRDAPSVSTGRAQSLGNRITLSPAEREIARNSFSDPTMTDADKERSYAMQKLKMLTSRANGTLNE
jgi:hypothetical protein